MAGRTSAEAVQNYLDPLRKALSCVTKEVLQVGGGYTPSDNPHSLVLGRGLPVPLDGTAALKLTVSQQYSVADMGGKDEGWKVSTAAYQYVIEDTDAREILAFHWHPFSGVVEPHVHLGSGAKVGRKELQKTHIPTSRISVERVIRFAIDEFAITPLRPDWSQVLSDTEAMFEKYRTW